MRSCRTFSAATLALTLVVPSFVAAQQTRQPAVQVQVQPRTQSAQTTASQQGQGAQWQNGDQLLAGCVAIANQKEVALAEFGRSKADGNDVKKFIDMVVKDHQAFLQKLQQHTPEAARELNEQHADRSTNSGVQTAAGTQTRAQGTIQQTAGTAQGSRSVDLLAIDRAIAEKCLATAKEELSSKKGDEFDKCFMDMQIMAHSNMKDSLEVLQDHVSPELRNLLAEGLQTTEQHLKKAKEIRKDMKEEIPK